MNPHMEHQHGGGEPAFVMRVVECHQNALSRQTGNAVRIMRREGAGSILNSRGEFNRCYIPRLMVEEPGRGAGEMGGAGGRENSDHAERGG